MAIVLTTSAQKVASSDNGYFEQALWAWYENKSDNTATLRVDLRITNISGQYYYGTNKRWAFNTSVGGYDDENPWSRGVSADETITVKQFDKSGISGGTEVWLLSEFESALGGQINNSVYVQMPVFGTQPSDPYIQDVESTTSSFAITFGIGDIGDGPSTFYMEGIILSEPYVASGIPQRYTGWYSDTERRVTIDNNSTPSAGGITMSANNRYYAGILAQNGLGINRFDMGPVYTVCPAPTALALSSQTHYTFDIADATLSFTVPTDGGALTKTIAYRYSIDGGDTYSEWTDSTTTVASGSQTSGTFHAFVPTSSTVILEISSRTNAGYSTSRSITFTSIATHEAPTIGTWTFVDTNAETIAVTGDSTIFIESKSTPLMTIASSEISPHSGTTIVEVSGEFNENLVIAPSGATYEMAFPVPTMSGGLIGTLKVKDSLGATASPSVTRAVIPYSNPSIELVCTRIDDDGKSRVNYSGDWSPIAISGTNKNTLTVQYRLIDKNGDVIPWTTITPTISGTEFSGVLNNLPTDYANDYRVELKITDVFSEQVFGIDISVYNKERILKGPGYDIEIWTRDNEFVADISKYIEGDLNMEWQLNDIEEVSFNVNLDLLEQLQNDNVSLANLLIPYKHDVRIRRDGHYIIGCQIVEANIQVGNDKNSLSVKATGYLNIFKDQYISMPMAGYSYPKMAHRLVELSQFPDCLVKNPTGDIDTSYWISDNSSIAFTTEAYSGAGAIQAISTVAFTTMATQMRVKQGETIVIDAMVSGKAGVPITFVERELVNKYSNQHPISSVTPTADNTYVHYTATFVARFDNPYLYIQQEQNTIPLRADNVFVYSQSDNPAYYNQYVATIYGGVDDTENGNGHNYADSGYVSIREFDYELQNVKDAIIDLTEMGDDYFEFEFTPDKIFNTYTRKGSDRTDIEITYPGNVQTMTANLSASNMANKIQEIGSGIGDERLEVWATNDNSRAVFGNRESVVTANNVSIEDTLQQMANGELNERGKLINEISVVIGDGSINCGNIQTGDVVMFRLENYLGLATSYLSKLATFEGWYRVMKVQARVSNDNVETLTLTLKWAGGFDES